MKRKKGDQTLPAIVFGLLFFTPLWVAAVCMSRPLGAALLIPPALAVCAKVCPRLDTWEFWFRKNGK